MKRRDFLKIIPATLIADKMIDAAIADPVIPVIIPDKIDPLSMSPSGTLSCTYSHSDSYSFSLSASESYEIPEHDE